MALEFYSKTFLNKEFDTVDDTSYYPNGLVSEDWRACVLLYRTMSRFGIPHSSLKMEYETLDSDEQGNIHKIRITRIQSPTNRTEN